MSTNFVSLCVGSGAWSGANGEGHVFERRLRSWLVLFAAAGALVIAGLAAAAEWRAQATLDALAAAERVAVARKADAARHELQEVIIDICVESRSGRLTPALSGDPAAQAALARDFVVLMEEARRYDQLRLIDATGRERVRVDRRDGHPAIVPADRLQAKAGRYYVAETLALQPGELFVSPLDLNVEHGRLDSPWKPVVRVAAPVGGSRGETAGLVIANTLATPLLDTVGEAGSVSVGRAFMLNDAGYWLIDPDRSRAWAFMFPGREHERLATHAPALWAAMSEAPEGQLREGSGLYTFATLEPLREIAPCGAGALDVRTAGSRDYRWIVGTLVPAARLGAARAGRYREAAALAVPLLGGVAAASYFGHLAVAQRRRDRAELERRARVDALTGLANRATFDERLERELMRSRRHRRRCAVLYLDLDGFKAINDRLGHAAGDDVLVKVARTLEAGCREDDTIARLGGDEFALLLPEIASNAAARRVAEDIVRRVGALGDEQWQVGASVGIACWPDDAMTPAALMLLADQAMYAAKQAGKSRVGVPAAGLLATTERGTRAMTEPR